jgi:hypothetical protein
VLQTLGVKFGVQQQQQQQQQFRQVSSQMIKYDVKGTVENLQI